MKNLQKKLSALLFALVLTFSLAACGQAQNGDGNKPADPSKSESSEKPADSAKTGESIEDLKAQIEKLTQEENAIFDSHKELWDKVFLKMDKQVTPLIDKENFSYVDDVLLKTINDNIKDFTEEEVKILKADAEKIRELENKINELTKKISELEAADDSENTADSASSKTFPAFEGKDFAGNSVDNSIFSKNAVTVVNYWFSGCAPCVGELPELNALNEELKAKGGAVIGINTETLNGDANAIAEAQEILKKQGASYQNIYFDPSSEAGKMAMDIVSFPTTIVVDRNGNIVGEPLLGAISNEQVLKDLQARIDSVLAKDKK